MDDARNPDGELESLVGRQVVVDVNAPYVYIGTLRALGREALVLKDADVHLRDDSQTTQEVYVLEARRDGVRANRSVVYVMRSAVVSMSRLEDVILY